MDILGPILGPGAGAAVVGLLWTLQHVLRRRSDAVAERAKADAALVLAEAQTESAAAGAVVELLNQLRQLRGDLDREVAARLQLAAQVEVVEDQLAEERSRRSHLEGQIYVLQREKDQAVKWAEALANELAELRRQIQGSHTLPSSVPRT